MRKDEATLKPTDEGQMVRRKAWVVCASMTMLATNNHIGMHPWEMYIVTVGVVGGRKLLCVATMEENGDIVLGGSCSMYETEMVMVTDKSNLVGGGRTGDHNG
ncbi:hypothetical protein VNO78_07435 [Psophocarpus tetragonolobus]|uniref:Uncharacterized protein n=1 Tax=Psophocarpus tetragonolobus TaxID=3891 RepID=A0AAN9SU85_PSOTE